MNSTANRALPSSSLADKAMLVHLRRTTFNDLVTDKAATNMVDKATNVGKGKGRYKKRLFTNSKKYEALCNAYRELYEYHTKHTLPWEDRGARLLPSNKYMKFTDKMRILGQACDAKLNEFLIAYHGEITADRTALGSLFNIDDYPTQHDMRAKWGYKLVFQPVPAAGDFRIDVDDSVKAALEEAVQERIQAAQGHVVSQLLEPLQVAVERLSKQPGEAGATFRDSLVHNIRDAAARMSDLVGLADNPALAAMVERANNLADALPAPEALRNSVGVRKQAADASKALVDDLVGMFGGG